MKNWYRDAFILCLYGGLLEFRPSEMFFADYLTKAPMNFTSEQVSTLVNPIPIFTMLLFLVTLFVIIDFIPYKTILIANSIFGILIFLLVIFAQSLIYIQLSGALFGFLCAAETVYFFAIYVYVDKEKYQVVSSYTRAAHLIGRSLSGITGQTLISLGCNYDYLLYLSLGGMISALVCISFLSPPQYRKISLEKEVNVELGSLKMETNKFPEKKEAIPEDGVPTVAIRRGFTYLWGEFKTAFSNNYVLKWTAWSALASCCFFQVWAYIQLLWVEVSGDEEEAYYSNLNGVVECISTLLSALGAYLMGKITLDWKTFGNPFLVISSFLLSLVVVLLSQASAIWVAYLAYLLGTIIYNSVITITHSEIAKNVSEDSCDLIFVFITFITMLLEALLTGIVVYGFRLPPRYQFEVYGGYFLVLGILFAFVFAYVSIRKCFRSKKITLNEDNIDCQKKLNSLCWN